MSPVSRLLSYISCLPSPVLYLPSPFLSVTFSGNYVKAPARIVPFFVKIYDHDNPPKNH